MTGSHRSRPQSAASPWTGVAGAAACLGTIFFLRDWPMEGHERALAVLGVVAGTMAVLELSTRPPPRPVVSEARPDRILRKTAGIAVTAGAVAAVAWLFPEYHGTFYDPCRRSAQLLLPVLLAVTPLYVWWTDRRFGEEDVYARLGAWLLRTGVGPPRAELVALARATAVKAFFFPLMFVYATRAIAAATEMLTGPPRDTFVDGYRALYDTAFLIDLSLTSVGYALALRLLGTQPRTSEPTVLGWVACLLCYQPFWSIIGTQYLAHETDGVYWDELLEGTPLVLWAWGSAILACIWVYVWASMSFGLRFSNLSNRGIITDGPYRWMKHPAYVSKNLSWWLVSAPFLTQGAAEAARACGLLLLVNGVYLVRARTEERHLRSDPDYVAYEAWIARNGLWARARRWGAGSTPTARTSAP